MRIPGDFRELASRGRPTGYGCLVVGVNLVKENSQNEKRPVKPTSAKGSSYRLPVPGNSSFPVKRSRQHQRQHQPGVEPIADEQNAVLCRDVGLFGTRGPQTEQYSCLPCAPKPKDFVFAARGGRVRHLQLYTVSALFHAPS